MLILKRCRGLWEEDRAQLSAAGSAPAQPVVFAVCRASDELKHPLDFPR